MKYCSGCKQEKPFSDFNKNRRTKDGLQTWCQPCNTMWNRRNYLNRKEYFADKNRDNRERNRLSILAYLREHPCVDCGESDPVVLEFDHVRGDKRHNVSELSNRICAWKTIQDEIDKCEVRCANCHRRATARRSGSTRLLEPAS